MAARRLRTLVYVDAFNLYYGCLKGTPYKWLDLARLCEAALPPNDVVAIRYFTARVSARGTDASAPTRQQIYLRALATLPTVSVHFGQFATHRVRLPLADPSPGGPRTAEVLRTEEKGSDVNLATAMLVDGFKGRFEAAVVVSNDSDLVAPIRAVREELGLVVGVLNPHHRTPSVLARHVDFVKPIRPSVVARSQLPDQLTDAVGTITKPERW